MYSPSIVHCIVRAPIFRKNLSSTHGIASISGLCRIRKTDFRKCRQLHDEASLRECMCYSLSHRTLLKVQGQDTGSFLQGLVTNDVNLLTEAAKTALYAHMLNVQGRTLFDIIIYSLKEKQDAETGVLLECDSTVEDSVLKHLKVYKLRRRVTISRCPELALWAVLPQDTEGIHGVAIPGLRDPEKVLAWAADPRTTAMGWRLVADKCASPVELIKASRQGETEDYHKHRYAIGLPEGVKDLPPGVALPLESNLVYMQGISFTKGCYLGQELTARTHHTGVVRKRLMPVQLSAPAGASANGAPLLTPSGKPAGKLRVSLGAQGLGLVRLAHAKELLLLRPTGGADVPLEASVPTWWPQDGKKN